MLWSIYLFTFIILLYSFLDITWRLWKRKLSFLPTHQGYPWLGILPYIIFKDSHELYLQRNKWNEQHNYLFIVWFLTVPAIRIARVDYVESLLKSQEMITKSALYDIVKEWLGEGLLISKGKKWKNRRVSLTGAFHFSILNDFMEIYERHARNLVDKLKTLSNNGKPIEIQQLASLSLLDVICETSMGVEMNAVNSSHSEYVQAVHDIKGLLLKRFGNPFYRKKTLYQYTTNGKRYFKCLDILHNFTLNVINENIALREKNSNIKKDGEDEGKSYRERRRVFIDILLDCYEAGEIDIDGIREEVDTFMFEGHDTTSSALSWILYEIGAHPEVQQRIHDEIETISQKDCPLMDKIRQLKYTECAIKESLRLHPPVLSYMRKLEKDGVLNGNVIPSGTVLVIDAYGIHKNPAYWDEPERFDPSRFEGDQKRNPYCYVPFSAGPRNCIGQKFAMLEEKVFIYYILLNFRIESMQKRDEIKTGIDLILHSLNGIHIKFTPRN